MKRVFLISLIFGISIWALDGCSASSPRFGKSETKKTTGSSPKQGPRFSSKEAEEESKEDTKKVDPKEVEKIKTGERSFRSEKNNAIKPLDQSRMMREISRYMGVPYVSGGSSEEGMDCSGYTMVVYKNALGRQLPRTSTEQAKMGIPVDFDKLKFGDLVFFNTTGTPASHVGIYLGDDLFAHASVSLGVTISSLQSAYFSKRYECARRIIIE